LLAEWCGKDFETVVRDFDRNMWLFAEEATAYGVADKVIDRVPEAPAPRVGEDFKE
jgi:ATP-dependent Clp protease protease subunit